MPSLHPRIHKANHMKDSELVSVDNQFLKKQYDQRYEGDYMDADAYSTWVHEGLATQRVKQTLQQIPGSPTRILDYGCGQGKWIPLLNELFPQAEIVGIDISEVAVEKASGKYPHCHFSAFDGERAPLADAGFDLVFSFHVLEHVLDISTSVRDIARLLHPGGYACIIFPCGNKHSFEERFVSLLKNGHELSPTGEQIFFFEKAEGHLRRMESNKTIALFAKEGLVVKHEYYSGQMFAALDWLVRGTGPHYINGMFHGVTPANLYASIKLFLMRRFLLRLNRFLGYRKLDLTKSRSILKRPIVRLAAKLATTLDRGLMTLARWEWEHRRHNKGVSVQYLVFLKEAG
jgi:ubiquinone/menaquinone biosynthesis C-methylase UbiE